MINLEIKSPAPDLEALRARALAAGAVPAGLLDQVDHFFPVPRGLLKLRIITHPGAETREAELIAYERPLTAGSRVSDYVVVPVDDPDRLREALSRSLGAGRTVRKRRELLMLGGTRIHLDTVERLGTFVELETEGNSRPEAAMREEHDRVIAALALDRSRFLPGAYQDLLEDRCP